MNNPAPIAPVTIGSKIQEKRLCAQCKLEIPTGEIHTFQGKNKKEMHVCDSCVKKINEEYEKETKNPNLFLALLLGLLAGLVAGAVWFTIVVISNWEIGYMAVGVGYLIGFAVTLGAGKKRGMNLQVMAAFITVMTLLLADACILAYFISIEIAKTIHFKTNIVLVVGILVVKGLTGSDKFALLFREEFMKSLMSPIGILIRLYGVYLAFQFPRARKIKV